ncbi:MAG TPA: hypothetical protein VIM64_23975, partial [Puia sp.]
SADAIFFHCPFEMNYSPHVAGYTNRTQEWSLYTKRKENKKQSIDNEYITSQPSPCIDENLPL